MAAISKEDKRNKYRALGPVSISPQPVKKKKTKQAISYKDKSFNKIKFGDLTPLLKSEPKTNNKEVEILGLHSKMSFGQHKYKKVYKILLLPGGPEYIDSIKNDYIHFDTKLKIELKKNINTLAVSRILGKM